MRLTRILLTAALFTSLTANAADQVKRSDDELVDEVRRRLATDPDVKGGSLDVDAKGGVVILRGKVTKDKQKVKAERLAKKVKGVTAVQNDLRVEQRL